MHSLLSTALLSTALVGCLVVAGSPNARAGTIDLSAPGFSAVIDPFLLIFDEHGIGSIAVNGGPTSSHNGTLQNDPTLPIGSVPQNVLTYFLPEPVVAGTVTIPDPGTTDDPGISDVIRFTDDAGHLSGITGVGTRMIYYSDVFDVLASPDNALADTGFPVNLAAGTTALGPTEVGSEEVNGFTYQPGAAYPANNVYIGTSDAPTIPVPEPASLALLGSALLGFGWLRRRNRSA